MVFPQRAIYAVLCLRLPDLDERLVRRVESHLSGFSWSEWSGKSLIMGFPTISSAIHAAACALQRKGELPKPSIGIAVGEGDSDGLERFEAVNLSRMLALEGSPGQVLLARSAYEVALSQLRSGASLQHLGLVLLEGGLNPQSVYQLDLPGQPTEFDQLEGTGEIRSNINEPPAGFIGREAEQRQLQTIIERNRTVSILGPGGIGKTTLARFVAYYATPDYLGGGWLIDFASVHADADVAGVVCADLRVRPEQDKTSTECLLNHLKQAKTLLVLDNCENLANPIGKLAEKLLSASETTVIITSREPLEFKGESVLFLNALGPPSADSSLRELEESTGIRLLLSGLDKVDDLSTLVKAAQLCEKLGGIPLALILANSRLHSLVRRLPIDESLSLLLSELDDSDDDGVADSPKDALDSILGWSFGGLKNQEQSLLLKLSTLEGSWSKSLGLSVAESLKLDKRAASKSLKALTGSGLLQDEGRSRFRILAPTQAFLHSLLEVYDEDQEGLRLGYARGVLNWVEEQWSAGEGMVGRTLDMLGRETQQILNAIEMLRLRDLGLAVTLFNRTYDYWLLRGPYVPASKAAECLIEVLRDRNSPQLARTLYQGAMLTGYSGRFGTAIDMAMEARGLSQTAGDTETYILASSTLALQFRNCDRRLEAREVLMELLERTSSDSNIERLRLLVRFAALLVEAGEEEAASPYLSAAVELNGQLKDLRSTGSLAVLRYTIASAKGDTQSALNHIRSAIRAHRQGGNYQGLADGVGTVAAIAKRLGQDEMSARLLGASNHMNSVLNARRPTDISARDANLGADLARVLGIDGLEREAAIGSAWTLEELMNYIDSV